MGEKFDHDPFQKERERMVERHMLARDIRDARVLEAMRTVPRHHFVGPDNEHLAYTDSPLPIGRGQTISQPYIVALMTQLLELEGSESVLEVGTGSGYQAAVLAYLVDNVYTIERHTELAEKAKGVFNKLEVDNVDVHIGDGSLGLPDLAPFQAIMVTAAAPDIPEELLDQLDVGGRMVIPVGSRWGQNLERWRRVGPKFDKEVLVPVTFVPLRGDSGWKENKWRPY